MCQHIVHPIILQSRDVENGRQQPLQHHWVWLLQRRFVVAIEFPVINICRTLSLNIPHTFVPHLANNRSNLQQPFLGLNKIHLVQYDCKLFPHNFLLDRTSIFGSPLPIIRISSDSIVFVLQTHRGLNPSLTGGSLEHEGHQGLLQIIVQLPRGINHHQRVIHVGHFRLGTRHEVAGKSLLPGRFVPHEARRIDEDQLLLVVDGPCAEDAAAGGVALARYGGDRRSA
mmetsp:Transcript_22612/g.65088  ORF Transcript_22612/g.65088 Transcript_22612/m.65088 type:complete len:227 (-) Transcript_22612:301-981(-)